MGVVPVPEWQAVSSVAANVLMAMVQVDYAAHGLKPSTPCALNHIPPGEPPHREWEAFRRWPAAMPGDELHAMLTEGLTSNLDYYRTEMEPVPEVERYLQELGTANPTVELLADRYRWMLAARVGVASWPVADPEAALAMAAEPERLRQALLRFLDELWERAFTAEWEAHHEAIQTAVEAAERQAGAVEPVEDLVVR